ncbi:MAG TPA: hypothetical protein VI485_26230 [Vicinamibacterales bacterium]|nr:hypothetical protein [Vicinamibacterales bacterium]
MEVVVLVTVLALTVAVAAGLAKGVLSLVLHLIVVDGLPAAALEKPAAFITALLFFWFLAPAVVESPAAATLLALLAR